MAKLTRVQTLIREAFLSLLAQKGFADTSVKDILDKSGVSRSGFYAHYEDKYFLRASIEDEVLDELAAAFSIVRQSSTGAPLNTNVPNAAEYFALYYECLERNEDLIRQLLAPKSGDHFLLRLIDLVGKQQRITREAWGARSVIPESMIDIYTAGLTWTYVGVFIAWINADKATRPGPREMGEALAGYFG